MACDKGICFVYSFLIHLIAYFAILAILVSITVILLKCMGDWRDHRDMEEEINQRSETMPLMHQRYDVVKMKGVTINNYNYGACQQQIDPQIRTTTSTSTSTSTSSNNSTNTSINTVYDTRICTICYDDLRNCFFVPCGHCATCYLCALRIFQEENRHCPICRRYIGKVGRLSV